MKTPYLGSKRLYIRNLSPETTENEIYDLFAAIGKIEIITFSMDRVTQQNRGRCTIDMETWEMAQSALRRLNGQVLHGQSIHVSVTRPPNLRASPF